MADLDGIQRILHTALMQSAKSGGLTKQEIGDRFLWKPASVASRLSTLKGVPGVVIKSAMGSDGRVRYWAVPCM